MKESASANSNMSKYRSFIYCTASIRPDWIDEKVISDSTIESSWQNLTLKLPFLWAKMPC